MRFSFITGLLLSASLMACESNSTPDTMKSAPVPMVGSEAEVQQAKKARVALGIASVIRTDEWHPTSAQGVTYEATRMNLLDGAEQVIGTVELQRDKTESAFPFEISIRMLNGKNVDMELSDNNGSIRLTQPDSGASGLIIFDETKREFLRDTIAEELARRFGQDLLPLGFSLRASLDDYRSASSVEDDLNAGSSERQSGLRLWCGGSIVRGNSFNVPRSICCDYAAMDAANQCSNAACYGCCAYSSCDALCALGDYGCYCGITARACAF